MREVLIAELGTPTRWGQFSPHFETVRDYFGGEPDQRLDIRMRAVSVLGAIQQEEFRTSIPKDSRNWSFEIGAVGNLEYPTEGGRPIVIFLRQSDGSYLYRLLMPGDQHYNVISQELANKFVGSANRIPQSIMSAEELKQVWPDSPLWDH
jgi:hypothetical protein